LDDLIDALFARSPAIRYVAVYRDGLLTAITKPGVTDISAAESDTCEELLVNPTLLTLLSQRGNIDCGGLLFVVIRYGNFYSSWLHMKAATSRSRSNQMQMRLRWLG
jgi:hypothetical protein